MKAELFIAFKAFIKHDGNVLILRESSKYKDGTNKGKFDVVGGKLRPGERFDEGLLREIKEETGLDVRIGKPFFAGEWRPVVKGKQLQIVGVFFECFSDSANVRLSRDHDKFMWIRPEDYKKHGLISNLLPAFEAYLEKV